MSDDPGIAFAIVDPVLHALAELGYDADEHRHAVAGAAMVGGSRVDALLDLAAAELADSTLALSLAPRIPIGRLGDLDYALCTSSTLRDGLGRLERFYGVLTQRVKLSLVESPPQAALRLRRREGITHSRHWIEFSFAMIAERIRQILARDVQFREVTFRHAAPPSRSAYDAFFGTTVRFGAAEDRMGFASPVDAAVVARKFAGIGGAGFGLRHSIAQLFDGAYQVAHGRTGGIELHGGGGGGKIHVRRGYAWRRRKLILDAAGACRAGHAGQGQIHMPDRCGVHGRTR